MFRVSIIFAFVSIWVSANSQETCGVLDSIKVLNENNQTKIALEKISDFKMEVDLLYYQTLRESIDENNMQDEENLGKLIGLQSIQYWKYNRFPSKYKSARKLYIWASRNLIILNRDNLEFLEAIRITPESRFELSFLLKNAIINAGGTWNNFSK